MPEIRRDPIRNNMVAIVTERAVKPTDLPVAQVASRLESISGGFCPFCPGNEAVTPPELAAVRPEGTAPDSPGWEVRAFPNKFSAFSAEIGLETISQGLLTANTNFGTHEVVVECPQHGRDFHEYSPERVESIMRVLQERYRTLAADSRFKYIQVYKNKGIFAGASLAHSHMQIVGLPYVPGQWQGAQAYAAETGKCVVCDLLQAELDKKERIVFRGEHFAVICPFASRFPYETWIVPFNHRGDFAALEGEALREFAGLTLKVSRALADLLDNPSFNMVFNTAPVNVAEEPFHHWMLEFWPRLIVNAGVEIATGCYMNPISPEWAAENLRAKLQE